MSSWKRSIAEIQEGVRLALYAIRSNKFRSLMTIVGVMIGVGAVILVNTIMDGFNEYAEASIDQIGSNPGQESHAYADCTQLRVVPPTEVPERDAQLEGSAHR